MTEWTIDKLTISFPRSIHTLRDFYFCRMIDFDARLYELVDAALKEDVGDGDHSTLCCIPAGVKGKAVLKIKQEGILAGVSIAEKIFTYAAPGARMIIHKNDGEEMQQRYQHHENIDNLP